ncbi:hypothetical protein GCM10010441_29590 [Kitasatospora paracochleata]|uniref:Cyanobacterial TRADD-N associated 2 transmembrane domain-containing protein n=1 Tax=Kitasatospora paracochleata TaxID=58354 RepID=A0ABT1J8Z7_9ACTN|nr:hypothetical protein [Kitasatospora paracochleata]MCP2313920.1 hypothetical protein [Kitasatospora paracochleata]
MPTVTDLSGESPGPGSEISVTFDESSISVSSRLLLFFLGVALTLALTLSGLLPLNDGASSQSGGSSQGGNVEHMPDWMWVVLAVCAGVLTVGGVVWLGFRAKRDRAAETVAVERAALQRRINEKRLANLKAITPLAELLELNQKQIDAYHRIATGQADRSFRSSQWAMWIGLAVVVVCFAVGLKVPSGEAKIFIGAMGGVGTVLSGYLSRTYLQVYGQTLAQLNRYFEQPVLTGYYLTAERLAKDLPDTPEGEMRRKIIDQVLQASAALQGTAPVPSPRTPSVPGARRKRPAAAAAAEPSATPEQIQG